MLGEIGNITTKVYEFDNSNSVSHDIIPINVDQENKNKKDQFIIDSFTKSKSESNTTYNKSGIIDQTKNDANSLKSNIETNQKSDTSINGKVIKPEEKKQIDELKSIDSSVKAHEQAHMSAGGGLVRGGVTYQYQKGPDGQLYAVGGEVQIDISPISGNPEATIAKMQQVRRSALAPADPSGQDKQVAGIATQIESQALQQKQQSSSESSKENKKAKIHSKSGSTISKNNLHKHYLSANLNVHTKINTIIS